MDSIEWAKKNKKRLVQGVVGGVQPSTIDERPVAIFAAGIPGAGKPSFIIVDETVIYCRKNQLDFILDGTFGSDRAVENVRSALKRHDVTIFYVWKEPSLAWQHTVDRQLVTKRGIDKNGFIKACLNVPKNLRAVRNEFGSKILISAIKKEMKSDNFQMTRSSAEINKLLEINYTKKNLERTLL